MEGDGLWTYKELAAYLHVSERTAKTYVAKRGLPHVNIGSTIRFRRMAVEQWLDERTVTR